MKFKNKFLFIIFLPFWLVTMGLVYFYKFCISPFLPHTCKFTPTCSTYFASALKDYGFLKGSLLGIKRLLKCNPWSKGGIDPLKPNIKGNIKWIL